MTINLAPRLRALRISRACRGGHIRLRTPENDAIGVRVVRAEFIGHRIPESHAVGHHVRVDAGIPPQVRVGRWPQSFRNLGGLNADVLLAGAAGDMNRLRPGIFLNFF